MADNIDRTDFEQGVRMFSHTKILYLALAFILLGLQPVHAATITAASCSQANVQTALNSAASGDTVKVPGGSASWSGVNFSGRVTLDGGGCTVTGSINITLDGTNAPRLTNFNFTNSAQTTFIFVYGVGPGLIDHNTFNGGAASEMIHNMGMGASDASGWSVDVTPGGPNMLFIEDNTFTYNASGNPAYFWGSSAVQAYYGARNVVRHNTMNMVQVDQHGTAGMIGARWWEIYDNTFVTVANANQSNYMALRAGSGVIFGNTHTGPNDGAGSIELYEEDSGYPALYQVGRGINQTSSPAYVWGNSADMNVGSGSSNVMEGRDFMVSATQPATMTRSEAAADGGGKTYSYVPYTYPHPLQGGSTAQPSPPTNVSLIVN